MSTSTSDVGEEDRTTVEVDHRPARATSIAAVVAAVIAALTSAPFATLAIPLGFGGAVLVAAGLFAKEDRAWVTFGAIGLFLSVVVSGLMGTELELLLISTAATALAWDFGQHAISLGEHLGRHSRTWRNEALHASASTIVATIVAGLGYGIHRTLGGAHPIGAVAFLSVGLVVLLWAIRT